MKRHVRRLPVILLILVMSAGLLAGCGSSAKPTAEDAQAYVKAVLDMMCTGDYDHSITLSDVEEGTEAETRNSIVDEVMTSLSGAADLSEETKEAFKQVLLDAIGKGKYVVGDAVEADDGYDVTVYIEPFRLYDGFAENYEKTITERVQEDPAKVMAMSESEQTDFVMQIMIELMRANIDDPKYDPAEEITVHYGLLDEEANQYGCTGEEGRKLGEKIFSTEGME